MPRDRALPGDVMLDMFRKGEIRKRTFSVHGPHLTEGASLKQDDKTVGEIRHVSGQFGLALTRIDRLSPDNDQVLLDDTPVTILKPEYLS